MTLALRSLLSRPLPFGVVCACSRASASARSRRACSHRGVPCSPPRHVVRSPIVCTCASASVVDIRRMPGSLTNSARVVSDTGKKLSGAVGGLDAALGPFKGSVSCCWYDPRATSFNWQCRVCLVCGLSAAGAAVSCASCKAYRSDW